MTTSDDVVAAGSSMALVNASVSVRGVRPPPGPLPDGWASIRPNKLASNNPTHSPLAVSQT